MNFCTIQRRCRNLLCFRLHASISNTLIFIRHFFHQTKKSFLRTLESRIIGGVGIIGGLDIVIINNNRGVGIIGGLDGAEKIVQAVS